MKQLLALLRHEFERYLLRRRMIADTMKRYRWPHVRAAMYVDAILTSIEVVASSRKDPCQ